MKTYNPFWENAQFSALLDSIQSILLYENVFYNLKTDMGSPLKEHEFVCFF